MEIPINQVLHKSTQLRKVNLLAARKIALQIEMDIANDIFDTSLKDYQNDLEIIPEVWLQVHEFCKATRELCQCIRKEASRRHLENAAATSQDPDAYLELQEQMLQKFYEQYAYA